MTFLEEWHEFWRLMGTRAFWALPDHQRHGALIGLWYSHAVSGEPDDFIHIATREYVHREEIIMRGTVQTLSI